MKVLTLVETTAEKYLMLRSLIPMYSFKHTTLEVAAISACYGKWYKFYRATKGKITPDQRKAMRVNEGTIVNDKEFYKPMLNTLPM